MKKALYILLFIFFIVSCSDTTGDSSNSDELTGDESLNSSISFDLDQAVGFVKVDSSTESALIKGLYTSEEGSSQPFKKILSDGTISDFIDGSISISDIFVSSIGKVYLLLSSQVSYEIDGTEILCSLIEIATDSSFSCVDTELTEVLQPCLNMNSVEYCTDPIQSDDEGNIYYVGYNTDDQTVLRKKTVDSGFVDLTTDNMTIDGFIVAPDGRVYIAGMTNSSSTYWLRRIDTNYSLHNILGTNEAIEWMKIFPNGNLYITSANFDSPAYLGSFIVDTTEGTITNQCWLQLDGVDNENNKCDPLSGYGHITASYIADDLCDLYGLGDNCLETFLIDNFYTTPENEVFATVGDLTKKLWKVYPTIEYVDLTLIDEITGAEAMLGYLAIYGLDTSLENKFVLYNISTGQETDLIPDDNVEIYHAKIRDDGRIWFDGHRFDDNQYVIGFVDTQDSNSVTYLATTSSQLLDLILF